MTTGPRFSGAMQKIALLFVLMICLSAVIRAQSQADTYIRPTDAGVAENLKQWQGYKFGVLIHMGLYSQLGIVESWALCPEEWCGRPNDDYCSFAAGYRNTRAILNPVKFDPQRWAKAIKGAGAKYVIYSMKHHDGFRMYDSKYTDFKITDKGCPFSVNPKANTAKEVFNACRAEGLIVGAYFSKPDWSSPDFGWPYFPPKDRNPNYDITKHPERWKRFVDYTQNQLNEITSDYGKLDILWLDGCWVMPKSSINKHVEEFCKYPYDLDIDMRSIATRARQKQPGMLIVDRWVQGPFEDYLTPEQKTPDKALTVPWESCITLGDAWGWVPNDNYKPSREVIRLLVRIVAKGGNLLLGFGPDGSGEFDPKVYQRLEEIGKWLNINGEAIYGTVPVEPFQDGNMAYTSKGTDTVYAIYLPGNDETELPERLMVKTTIKAKFNCTLLASGQRLRCSPAADGLTLFLTPELRRELVRQPAIVIKITAR